ncbi:MAG: Asp-tRNA(Asn)/Glu-tRNA(Gln) amidotransferase subunit GatC [Planctomycetes bacterium]|nr:Asp-tRNA(Asn)/Glu-tRNA(Gln) amidotransferase subunit GatC [Planctomycetota bacterium]
MAFTSDEVNKIAKLARIELTDDEVKKMGDELGAIIGYIELLQEVDTEGIEEIAQVTGLVNVVRADEETPMFSTKEVLQNAPQSNEVAFLVPKAVER